MTNTSNGASPEQLEREIAQTRSEIDATLTAIQDKLSPGQVLDEALGYARRNGGEFAGNVGRSVRDNPLPLALVGIGLTWLMMAGNRPNSETGIGPSSPDHGGGRTAGDKAHAAADWAAATGDDIKHKASDVAAAGEEGLHLAGETARQYGAAAKETYKDAQAGATNLARRAADGASRAQRTAGHFINDHPLVVGAVAVAAGAVLAAFVPPTRREAEAMGEEAAQARKAVRDSAEDTVQSAKKVAQAVRTGVKKGAAKSAGSESRDVSASTQRGGKVTATERDPR